MDPILRIEERDPGAPFGPWYFVESTAQVNVDDPQAPGQSDVDLRIEAMARRLSAMEEPQAIILVHGYNNPRKVVEKRYARAWSFVSGAKIADANTLWIGFRWPSESLFWPILMTSFRSMNMALRLLAVLGAALAGWFLWKGGGPWEWVVALATALAMLVALRISAYYRDHYRAANHGVLDLVEFVRKLDHFLSEHPPKAKVKLTFLGHSMGAFVVTNAVRTLSDVFDRKSFWSPGKQPGEAPQRSNSDIGSCLTFWRLLLVSPDIPAEALMTRRTNFLQPSLKRFPECWLFSNAGDAVLSLISTTANYFVFPNRRHRSGWRLGNARVSSPHAGIGNPPGTTLTDRQFLERVCIGAMSLLRMEEEHRGASLLPTLRGVHFGTKFSIVDCTSFSEGGGPVLSYSNKGGAVGFWHSSALLIPYLLLGWAGAAKDVHSGYFDFASTQMLMFGVAATGAPGLDAVLGPASKNLENLNRFMIQHRIRCLLASR